MYPSETASVYEDALKKGKKEYRSYVSKGDYPGLPVLSRVLPQERIAMGTNIGRAELPLELVVGTVTEGRQNAFSHGFFPLLPAQSEFGMKWKALCKAHLEEGIRDPIRVVEYMNRYYVQEGNKRVSVLKYYDAVEISAEITRVMPVRDGSEEVDLYYELLDFLGKSGLRQVEFSKIGSYVSLQKLMGFEADQQWPEEITSEFLGLWERFRTVYASKEKQLPVSSADALLAIIKLSGYAAVKEASTDELKKLLSDAWPELVLLGEEEPISLVLDPEKEKKQGIVGRVLGSGGVKRVAFVYDRTPEDSKWVRSHETGRQEAQSALGDRVITHAYFREEGQTDDELLEQVISDDNKVIFTASPVLLPASLRTAIAHPEVMILNCSLNTAHHAVRSYYARMYEIKFISGAVAGCLCGADHIGYIADYPIYGQIAGINAFAAGVALVNPDARVVLEWSSTQTLEQAEEKLLAGGIKIISSLDLSRLAADDAPFGLYRVKGNGERTQIASTVWQWGAYYELMLRRVLDGSLQSSGAVNGKALNYYWGLRAGVVGIDLSNDVPVGTRRLAAILQNGIVSGSISPFTATVYRQEKGASDKINDDINKPLCMEEIIRMDWLADNVIGALPEYEQLNEVGKQLFKIVGVDAAENGAAGGAL